MPMAATKKRRRPRGWSAPLLLAALLALPAGDAAAREPERSGPIGPGMRAVLRAGEIVVEARPERGEGWLAFARRLTGESSAADEVRRANGGRAELLAGRWYAVPYRRVAPELRHRALRAVFPDDCLGPHGWVHRVDGRGGGTGLWQLAEWLTGRGESFAAIRDFNAMEDEALRPDDRLVVPTELLPAAFRAGRLDCGVEPPTGDLAYERRGGREYAVYRLQRGEALYSSVVVRFTGLTSAADVNALAGEIAADNGIGDVTAIAANRPIRIPFDQLLPEYLPASHPRRLAYERDLSAAEGYDNTLLARDLSGITIILDAGHGGGDPGSTQGSLWESIYVYDVMLRVKELLETTTAATVVPTVRDGSGFVRPERDVLPLSRGHAVLTSPPYPIADPVTGVHLRWYLANSVLGRAVAAHGDPRKVVFVSFHADSLHPSLRGAMAYVASSSLSSGRYGKDGTVFASRREVAERPVVELALDERRQSEGLSRDLAEEMLAAFRRRGLAVHPDKPVRDKIIRHRKPAFVPAVLRYNAVPAKMLLEICNLANPEDRRLVQTRAFRQRVAEATVEALVRYYGTASEGPTAVVTAAAAR